ncbi:MAG: hypothetical protein IJ167_07190 [Lachnospiraceae bacterium]|nr:hypothetical protein [Lachnospiraceae bacterium]
MKDQVFVEFEKWFKNKETDWNKEGIFIKEIHYEIEKEHCYRIGVESENGLGNIALYESNNIYWIDLEAGNYDYDVMFIISDIRFKKIEDINSLVDEWSEHLTWTGN